MTSPAASTLNTIRGMLLTIFALAVATTGAELLLLEHTADPWQWAPIGLLAISLVVLGWRLVDRRPRPLHVFKFTMILFMLSGCAGLWLHHSGNAEFEKEMYPTLSGVELFWEALSGATPALAPASMIGLGMIGLAYAHNHPDLLKDQDKTTEKSNNEN
jgi:hypothetical protein